MKTQFAKWGNSLAVRIPATFAKELAAEEGTEVELTLSRGKLVVEPLLRRVTLKELVDGITAENRHEATDWGKPVGKEIW